MKNIFSWPENQVKRVIYKKYLLEKDIEMAISDNSIERVIRIVPKHSRDIFLRELKKLRPELTN